jgi:hypothetical protein
MRFICSALLPILQYSEALIEMLSCLSACFVFPCCLCLQHNEALIDEFIHFSMGDVYSFFMLGGPDHLDIYNALHLLCSTLQYSEALVDAFMQLSMLVFPPSLFAAA